MSVNTAEELWIIDDDQSIRWVLERAVEDEGFSFRSFKSADEALDELPHSQPQAIITDIRMPGTDGLVFLDKVSASHPNTPIIITTAHSNLDSAVAAYQGGAYEYLPKPFDIDEAMQMINRALQLNEDTVQDERGAEVVAPEGLIGEAPAMQEVFRAIGRLSQSAVNVLITGESGTGKELVAQALHRHSKRSEYNFIAINVAAIPQELIESELFGHEKGAFTGASSTHQGRFEQADGGTLFLDEIGDMPADAQTRLLRVLATGEFYRVGGQRSIKVDVRVIAATHQDLRLHVERKQFREDLYHRLNVIRIQLPKLSERREDIVLLSAYFLRKIADELAIECKQLDAETQALFEHLPWPGNVRQLENTCRWLSVMAPGKVVSINDLPAELSDQAGMPNTAQDEHWSHHFAQWVTTALNSGQPEVGVQAQQQLERVLIEQTLNHTQGKRAVAAQLLGWGRNTLTRKIKEHEIK